MFGPHFPENKITPLLNHLFERAGSHNFKGSETLSCQVVSDTVDPSVRLNTCSSSLSLTPQKCQNL